MHVTEASQNHSTESLHLALPSHFILCSYSCDLEEIPFMVTYKIICVFSIDGFLCH